ncbi:MAG: hypothetical protein HY328_13390 [Chloroflexi bacterium]|nr:hypothetical protein [Chloroflexota bacterium]
MATHILTHPMLESATEIRVNFPAILLEELARRVPQRERDRFIVDSVERELRRLRLQAALQLLRDEQAWTDANHPDLMTVDDVDVYVRALRERPSAYTLNSAVNSADE